MCNSYLQGDGGIISIPDTQNELCLKAIRPCFPFLKFGYDWTEKLLNKAKMSFIEDNFFWYHCYLKGKFYSIKLMLRLEASDLYETVGLRIHHRNQRKLPNWFELRVAKLLEQLVLGVLGFTCILAS